jgi:uncharacterized LabA/DUF88 family protein
MESLSEISMPTAAVFIDGPWLYYALKRLKFNQELNFQKIFEVFEEYFGNQTPIYYFDVLDPQDIKKKQFISELSVTGYFVELARLVRRKKGANETVQIKGLGSRLIVRINSLPHEITTIVLITGDSDFAPVVEQLIQNGKKVVLITGDLFVSHSLVKAVDSKYVPLKAFLKNLHSGNELFQRLDITKKELDIPKNWYFEKGEHYAPYLVLKKLFLSAKSEITLIDSYVDDQILKMIPLLSFKVTVRIFTNKISPADFEIQVKKLRNNGHKVQVFKTISFHDRFLGIDHEWWHSGHSFKDIGSRVSVLAKIEDEVVIHKLQKDIDVVVSTTREYC